MTKQKVGVLHPGQMGVVVAQTILNSGHEVYWASEGRGADTAQRATDAGLTDAGSVKRMAELCQVIVSVCPPEFAEAVAATAAGDGFRGLYLDANAIAPERARRMERLIRAAGGAFVDGAIIGMPARARGQTWLYVSGENAAGTAPLFHGGPLELEVLGDLVGQASALKMCFAAYSKGTTALLAAVAGTAEVLGVRSALERQWSRSGPDPARVAASIETAARKAWRFVGEMKEIAETFDSAGIPRGFPLAAEEVYARMAPFRGTAEPNLTTILDKLRGKPAAPERRGF